ncbi:MAG: hypothetical protein LBB91_06535 [Clostridiales bacterium]|nr:hypothetical protein [Clostridiales bacterium]
MKKIIICLIILYAVIMTGLIVFAETAPDDGETSEMTIVGNVASELQTTVKCQLSEPIVSKGRGNITYKTTLVIKDMIEFYGYQISIPVQTQESLEIENKAGGMTTPTVHQNGTANFATIVGEGASGDIVLCDIVCKYPYADKNRDRELIIEELKIVTSITAERTITLTSDSPELRLVLPYAAPPFYTRIWFFCIIAAGLIAAMAIVFAKKLKN